MRILILTQWYAPEPAPLLQELAQTLSARGHGVIVLTGFPNYPSGTLYPGYRIRLCQREVLAGVPVVRVPLYPDHSRSAVRRVLNNISFALSSALLGPWLVKRPDVIFVYQPPPTIGLPAVFLGGLWRVPFVYQIQDMFPESLIATGMLTNGRILHWVGQFMRWVYARARSILVISPGFQRNLLDKGVPASKVHVISNWVDTETYHPTEPEPGLAAALGMAGRFNVIFAGNVGEAQGMETVIEAADLLRDLPDIQFVVVGDGIALPGLRQAVRGRNLSNVRFLGRYPAETMPRLYALADVLLVHLKDDPLFRITIPSKTITYMASGKPILAAVAGDAADVVTSVGAGIACPPENPGALAAAVRSLYELPDDQRQDMARRGLRAAQATYSRVNLVAQVEEALEQAIRDYRDSRAHPWRDLRPAGDAGKGSDREQQRP